MLDILIRGSSRGRNRISHPAAAAIVATVPSPCLPILPYSPSSEKSVETLWRTSYSLLRAFSLTFLLTIYIYIATSGDPVTVSIRALSRDAGIPRPAGINGNSDFFEVSPILVNRPLADLSEEFIYPSSPFLSLSVSPFLSLANSFLEKRQRGAGK